MAYEAQPGTIAFRAIAWLSGKPKGTEVTASVWGEAIDVDGNTLTMCIKPAVEAGVVKRATRDGLRKPFWFSLGDGVPLSKPEDHDEDDRPEQRVITVRPEPRAEAAPEVPASTPAPSPAPKPRAPAKAPAPERRLSTEEYVGRIGVEQAQPDGESVPFNACRYVDGSVIVVGVEIREDGAVIFGPKQAQALWRLRDAA